MAEDGNDLLLSAVKCAAFVLAPSSGLPPDELRLLSGLDSLTGRKRGSRKKILPPPPPPGRIRCKAIIVETTSPRNDPGGHLMY